MKENWPTKEKDLRIAQVIMEEYAQENNTDALGLFEVVVNSDDKQLGFRLSDWVLAIAYHFYALYGEQQGDYITRKVITSCITRGETIH